MNISWLEKFRRWRRLRFGWQWYRGHYGDWNAARAASVGYDHSAILERVVAGSRAVRAGEAAWERDGALFHSRVVNAPLLKALAACASEFGRLEVVDFGGSLGSTWWQHRAELANMGLTAWRVVEQPHFVQAGHEFSDGVLSFHQNLEDAWSSGRPTVLLFSGVLQCVEDPSAILKQAVKIGFPHILMDRTPFVLRGKTRLAVQHTPPELGGGTYPCWHFNQSDFLGPLNGHFRLVETWDGFDDVDLTLAFRGLSLRRKDEFCSVKGVG